MTSLSELFADDPAAAAPVDGTRSDQIARLRDVVGGPASSAEVPRPTSKTSSAGASALAAVVGERAPALQPARAAGSSDAPAADSASSRFGEMRQMVGLDRIGAVTAIVSVLAVVGVVSGATALQATSGDVREAQQSLRAEEADLRNHVSALETAQTRFEDAVQDAAALAEEADTTLTALTGKSDETARVTATGALGQLRSSVSAQKAASTPQYVSASLPSGELTEVATALDRVRATAGQVEVAIDDTRSARAAVEQSRAVFIDALSGFGGTLPTTAATIVAENTAAEAAYRDGVTAALVAVAAEQQAGGSGLAAMMTYASAVDSLRADNDRAIAEIEARDDGRSDDGGIFVPYTPPSSGGGSPAQPTTPPATDPPADPGTGGGAPTEPPVDPPVEPEPTPTDPQPEPTQPEAPVGG
ncbi:hypothetical protein ABC304_03065 [Microbacterium sp. 1P10UB]|uniref:hypothetical protein n=1 Tax=unclassified Microbacterium TaxID=2609290 RepID=UPI0039A2E5FA